MTFVTPPPKGGYWYSRGQLYDGHKAVCFDDFSKYSKDCLVYGFGLNKEWSFEENMAKFGMFYVHDIVSTYID